MLQENDATTFKFSHNYNITDFTWLILMVFKSAMCFPTMLVSWLLVVGPGSGAAPAPAPARAWGGAGARDRYCYKHSTVLTQTCGDLGLPVSFRHPDAPFHSSYSGLWVTRCS